MQLSPALHFNGHFPGIPKLAGTFWILIELKIMAMGVTTGATRCARSSQIITTNKTTPNFLQAGYPTCCPTNHQCQTTEGNIFQMQLQNKIHAWVSQSV